MALGARYLNRLPDEVLEVFEELERSIITDIARRIKEANYNLTSTSEWQNYKLKQLGYAQKEINKLIAKALNVSSRKVAKTMIEAVRYGWDSDNIIYKRAKKQGVNIGTLLDFKDVPQLQSILESGIRQTNWEMENYTRTMGATVSANYIKALDLAWLKVQSGAFTLEQAVKEAVTRLSRDGVYSVDYSTGRKDRLDVAVRRAVVTGCNKTNAEISLKRMDSIETDLVITTSHLGARPSHAVWQGKVFSYTGLDNKYPPFRESTGYGTVTGICGVNCRHSFFPYVEGVSENTMSDFNKRENSVLYEAEQEQRKIERNIREWKRREEALKSIGEDANMERRKVREWQERQREHIKRYNLQRQYTRESV